MLDGREERDVARGEGVFLPRKLGETIEQIEGDGECDQAERGAREVAGAELEDFPTSRPAPHHHGAPHQNQRAKEQENCPRGITAGEYSRQPGKSRDIAHAADRRQRAVAINEPLSGVRLQFPFGEHDRRADDGRGDAEPLCIRGARGEFQVEREHGVRIGALRERDEIGRAVNHRHDGRAVDGRRP